MRYFCLFLLVCMTGAFSQINSVGTIHKLDDALDELVLPDAEIQILAEGFDWSEGPVWIQDGNYLLFNDIPPNTTYKWSEDEDLSVFLRPAGYAIGDNPPGRELGCNGLFVHPVNNQLVLCDHGNRCIGQLNQGNWTKTVLVDRYQGKRLNSPNDLVISGDGHIYFTDPPYGLRGQDENPDKELEFNGVYHLSPDGTLELVTDELPRPNGIILSPDETKLYVANSGGKPIWLVFDIHENGSPQNGRLFYDAGELRESGKRGGCDGMTVDVEGNLWATGPGGVLVLSPQAELLGIIETGTATSNCCFGGVGGGELYITADMYLCRIKVKTKGIGF